MQHLSLRHGIFTRQLQRRAILQFQHDRIGEFLPIKVWRIRCVELGKRETLQSNPLVNLHSVRDSELEMTLIVDGDDSAFPEL